VCLARGRRLGCDDPFGDADEREGGLERIVKVGRVGERGETDDVDALAVRPQEEVCGLAIESVTELMARIKAVLELGVRRRRGVGRSLQTGAAAVGACLPRAQGRLGAGASGALQGRRPAARRRFTRVRKTELPVTQPLATCRLDLTSTSTASPAADSPRNQREGI
jgi:hypothetical protein